MTLDWMRILLPSVPKCRLMRRAWSEAIRSVQRRLRDGSGFVGRRFSEIFDSGTMVGRRNQHSIAGRSRNSRGADPHIPTNILLLLGCPTKWLPNRAHGLSFFKEPIPAQIIFRARKRTENCLYPHLGRFLQMGFMPFFNAYTESAGADSAIVGLFLARISRQFYRISQLLPPCQDRDRASLRNRGIWTDLLKLSAHGALLNPKATYFYRCSNIPSTSSRSAADAGVFRNVPQWCSGRAPIGKLIASSQNGAATFDGSTELHCWLNRECRLMRKAYGPLTMLVMTLVNPMDKKL